MKKIVVKSSVKLQPERKEDDYKEIAIKLANLYIEAEMDRENAEVERCGSGTCPYMVGRYDCEGPKDCNEIDCDECVNKYYKAVRKQLKDYVVKNFNINYEDLK